MVQNTKVLYLLSFLLMLTIGCEDTKDDDHDHDHDETIEQPTSYTFPSRFVEGESSVSYTGQVVRNMLHTDLKPSTDRAAVVTYMAADALMDFFDGDATSNSSYISTTPAACELVYDNISTGKNLSGKTNTDAIKGFGQATAVTAVESWINSIGNYYTTNGVTEATKLAYTNEDGHNMSQMINKVLYGAVGSYNAIGVYLLKFEDASTFPANDVASSDGGKYSAAEHYWDEAFGYFGAHRDFLGDQAQGTACVDLTSEYNFGWAEYARKRDENPGYSFDFRTDIFTAFVAGRTIIHNGGGQAELAEHIDMIKTRWEQLTAANVVHYINELVGTDGKMSALTVDHTPTDDTDASNDYNKYWSEMRGFVVSLQYIPHKLPDADLDTVVEHLGAKPLYPAHDGYDTYEANLITARDLLISKLSLN